MEEKAIVNDVLASTKASLKDYEGAIIETANMELRQTLQNLRNSSESFQYELFKLAESKDIILLLKMLHKMKLPL